MRENLPQTGEETAALRGGDKVTAWLDGAAHFLPPRSVANSDLPASLGADPQGIQKRTGIRSRHWAEEGVYTSDLGAEAARAAMANARITSAEIDCLIATTQTPDHLIPGIGVAIQTKLDLKDIPCFDLRNQCSGFLYALEIARSFIETRSYSCILIVSSELHSHGLGGEPRDAHITALFGDGAGAAIVTAAPKGARPLRVVWQKIGSDGRGAPLLRHRAFDMSNIPPWDQSKFGSDPHAIIYPEMDGEAVFRSAVKRMVAAGQAALKANDLKAENIAWLLPHQANASINKTVASILGFPPERALSNIERVGNCSGASLPILLSETLAEGRVAAGEKLLLVAFGAGYTWGAALLEAAP
jgi:3-oxoacyl-[acyl-carrier-protein] synthase-3